MSAIGSKADITRSFISAGLGAFPRREPRCSPEARPHWTEKGPGRSRASRGLQFGVQKGEVLHLKLHMDASYEAFATGFFTLKRFVFYGAGLGSI